MVRVRVRVLPMVRVLVVVRALLQPRDARQPVPVQLREPHAQLPLAPQPAHHAALLRTTVELSGPTQSFRELPQQIITTF